MDFSFPDEKVPVLKVEEYYDEANKDKRPMLLVYSDGRVIRPVSVLETEDYRFTLSKEKFKEVLAEIFDKNDFTTLSDEKILAEVSSPRRRGKRGQRRGKRGQVAASPFLALSCSGRF